MQKDCVVIREGIHIDPGSIAPNDDCGLDLWLSNAAENWIAETLNARPYTIEVKTLEGKPLARLLIYVRRLFLNLHLASTYPYGVILGDESVFIAYLPEIQKILRNLGVSRMELAVSGVYITRYRELFSDHDHISAIRQVVELGKFKSFDAILSSFSSKLRRSARKAEKEGVTISYANKHNIKQAYDLYTKVMREKGAPVYYPIERFTRILDMHSNSDSGGILVASFDDAILGIAVYIDSKRNRHLVQIASDYKYRNFRVSDLMVKTLLHSAFTKGIKNFDFLATHDTEPGVMEYKAKWGGRSEDLIYIVFHTNYVLSKLVDVGRWLSRWRAKK